MLLEIDITSNKLCRGVLKNIFILKILGQKKINDIHFEGKFAYLSCSFGIVIIDLERKAISDSYLNIGPNGVGLGIDAIWSAFSKEGKNARKLMETMERDYQNAFIDQIFTKDLVSKTTGLKGDKLLIFMILYFYYSICYSMLECLFINIFNKLQFLILKNFFSFLSH